MLINLQQNIQNNIYYKFYKHQEGVVVKIALIFLTLLISLIFSFCIAVFNVIPFARFYYSYLLLANYELFSYFFEGSVPLFFN